MRSAWHALAALSLVGSIAGCAALTGLSDLAVGDLDASAPSGDGSGSAPGDDSGTADTSTGVGNPDAPAQADAVGYDAPLPLLDAGDAGDSSTVVQTCSGTAGPTLVQVGAFCIDATEVTNTQYADFLAAKPPTTLVPSPECAYKSNFTPSASWPAAQNAGSNPVVYVDWCDAYAFCAWSGKHLCGAVGGGPSAKASVADVTVDEWYIACSDNGANVYPYGGNTYESGKCNDSEAASKGTRAVGSFTGCQGGYSGIFDMNGNAYEWEDACDVAAGASDACVIRGGAWDFSGSQYGGCNTYFNDYVVERSDTYNDTGFRCCSL